MIKYRKHSRIDIPYRIKWLNDKEINKFLVDDINKKTNIKKQEEWFDKYEDNKSKFFFTILDNNKPIGIIGLTKNNIFIVIGEKEYHNKGIGKKACRYIIDYSFNELKLKEIKLEVDKDNIAAIYLYKSLGFKEYNIINNQVYMSLEKTTNM